jgi:hypothetical protein
MVNLWSMEYIHLIHLFSFHLHSLLILNLGYSFHFHDFKLPLQDTESTKLGVIKRQFLFPSLLYPDTQKVGTEEATKFQTLKSLGVFNH